MNRLAKEAMKEYLNLDENFKLSLIEDVLLNTRSSNKRPHLQARLKSYLKGVVSFSTTNGVKSFREDLLPEDHLKPIKLFLPNGEFSTEKKGIYFPLGHYKYVNRSIAKFLERNAQRRMYCAWRRVESSLLTRKPEGGYGKVVLNAGSLSEQDVYFIKDHKRKRIKIGISKTPELRLDQVVKEYDCPGATLIHTIIGGGRELEKSLHLKFSQYTCEQSKGREWFIETSEIYEYIQNDIETKNSDLVI